MPLEGLNPDSLWAGPPAWELGTWSPGLHPSGGAFSLLSLRTNFFSFIFFFVFIFAIFYIPKIFIYKFIN